MARTTVRFIDGNVERSHEDEGWPPVTVEHDDDEALLWLSTNDFGLKSPGEPHRVYWRAALTRTTLAVLATTMFICWPAPARAHHRGTPIAPYGKRLPVAETHPYGKRLHAGTDE